MKTAAKVLKKENKKVNLNELEDMQDDMEDLLEDVGELNEIMGRNYGMPDDIEEDDLDAELLCLDDEFEMEAEADQTVEEDATFVPNVPNNLMSEQEESVKNTKEGEKTQVV